MTDSAVTFRLTAEHSALVAAVTSSKDALALFGSTTLVVSRQSAEGAQGIRQIGDASGSTTQKTTAMTAVLERAKGLLGADFGKDAVKNLISMADRYAELSARIALSTKGLANVAAVQAEVFAISQRTSTALDGTVAVYATLARSVDDYGMSQRQQLAMTESINKALALSNTSTGGAASAVSALSQALSEGVLSTDKFNAVINASPRLAEALANGLGLSADAMRRMVADGAVSGQMMIDALAHQAGTLDTEFAQLPLTVGRSMEQLRNAVTQVVGEASEQLGASSTLASGIAFLASHMGTLATAVGVVALAYTSGLGVALVKNAADKLQAILQTRLLAQAELDAARAAEVHAMGRVSLARAGLSSTGGLVAAEAQLAAAQARTQAATEASSLALTAKGAAMRAAGTAMAAFGGPVGLAITALTTFVMWARNSEQEATRLADSVSKGFQSTMGKLEGFSQEGANVGFAGLESSLGTLNDAQQQVEVLTRRYGDLVRQRDMMVARTGWVSPDFKAQMAEAAESLEVAKVKQVQLSDAYQNAIGISRDAVLQAAGLTDATDTQRSSLEKLLQELAREGQTLDQIRPHLQRWATEQVNVEAANRLAEYSYRDMGNAAGTAGAAIRRATGDVTAGLLSRINQLELQEIEQTQGKAAAMRAAVERDLAAKSYAPNSKESEAARTANEYIIKMTLAQDRRAEATRRAAEADREAQRVLQDNIRLAQQREDSQARYASDAARVAAQAQGPLALVEEERKQRITELQGLFNEQKLLQESFDTLKGDADRKADGRIADLLAKQAAPRAVLDTMSGEVERLKMSTSERERYNRELRNEQEMRKAINEANESGAAINAERTAGLIAEARAWAGVSIETERQVAQLQKFTDIFNTGISSIADLLADSFSGGLDGSKSFFDRLKDIFKKGWRDVLRTMLDQSFVRPLQEGMSRMMNSIMSGLTGNTSEGGVWSSLGKWFGGADGGASGTGGLKGIFQQVKGLFGGTSASPAGSSVWSGASTFTPSLLSGSGSWMAGSAAPNTLMGFGNNVGGFIGAGTGTAGVGAGVSGAGASASGAMAVPIIGWIIAGMMKNAELFDKGWDIANGESWAGKAATLGAVGHADDMFRKIGLNDKTASILSGSSIHAALFGRKKPTVEAQGLIGSYGFDAFTGQSFTDIKAKGGMFRSDKRWTEYGELDQGLNDAFGSMIRRTRNSVTTLADQLGVDIGAQLATVRVDLGKIKLDADPEKAKAQLEELQAGMVDKLTGTGVGMLGFQHLLDRGFEAGDVMNGLASAIALMTGTAQELGRALDGSEIDLVNRTTEMFQRLASTAGTTMEEQVNAITAAASGYGTAVGGAQQDIATAGFSGFATSLLAVKQEERERIRTLQDQAKALGGLTAREQDLATVRQAAQVKTDALVRTLEADLVDLALGQVDDRIQRLGGAVEGTSSKIEQFLDSLQLSDTLGTATDAERRVTTNDLMSAAALAGDADAFAQYAQQFLSLSRELNASGAGYQADYDRVLQMAQNFGGEGNAASLEQLYAQRDALKAQQEAASRLERAQRIAQGVSDLAGVRGGDPLDLLRSVTGLSPEALAGDLGMSVTELGQYLSEQKTDIGDLADILYELPKRIASEMVTALVDREVPVARGQPQTPATLATGTGASAEDTTRQLMFVLQKLDVTLARQNVLAELEQLK
ncbi:tape measure protein [Stenotrophomonas sp. 364]|uniref:tape measure protein n=1 Tax=Stenotrophomonas sp. 364 TaxID=2691571 RepID=UPI0013174331|nr:tape measure protein [Stenotrophomonas sp. 364]QHB72929.1 tape measure protein [Stenotrophomonas sp. 364]